MGLENYHAERKTTVTATTNHPNPCHILVLFPTGSKTGSISLWAHLKSEESGVSPGCSCPLLLLLQTPGLSSSFCGRKETWREEKFCGGAFFFPGPRDTKPWVRKLRILSPKRHRNFSTFRQHVLPPTTPHLTLFAHPPMTIRAQAAEMQ